MLVLASNSPRRRDILTMLGYSFEVCPADVDETMAAGVSVDDAVAELAARKAGAVFASRPGDIVLGADTVVVIGGDVLGKPRDEDDAARLLRMLSGRVHEVYTGVSIVSPDKSIGFFGRTLVEFMPLSERDVAEYIATGEPMDKAGAYGIQGRGSVLVRRIEGDFYNVMGLPAAGVHNELKSIMRL